MIPFNKAPVLGNELEYIQEAIISQKLCGDGYFSKKSESLLEGLTGCKRALLTPSCTAALELAAILLDLQKGDEVIMPSYTFVSTANAFVLRGAKIVFVDVEKSTMNIDPTCIEAAITSRTKVIVPVHYAGIACDMTSIMNLAEKYGLFVVEDAAQAIDSEYNGKALGTIGHLGTFSFHETKNITSGGEGGALLINAEKLVERAEIIREKGTNRSQFFRGSVDKYSWVDIGSSYLPSEIQAAYLFAQLSSLNEITNNRISTWKCYSNGFSSLAENNLIELPFIPDYATNNGHMFYLKCKNIEERSALIIHLKNLAITAPFHYVPLHSASAGLKYSVFSGKDNFTTKESERLIRLPLYYEMPKEEVNFVINSISDFFKI